MSLFRTLLRVAVEHSYNSSGVCPCLDFRPTSETSKLIDNLGLLCRKDAGGIQLVYDVERSESLELLARGGPASFDFQVFATDPDFKNYSEPYDGGDDRVLYFDNRAAKASEVQDLAVSGAVSDKDIVAAGAPELDGILTSRESLVPLAFVLRLFTGDKGEILHRWIEGATRVYAIRFSSRQRYWKYYLLGRLVRETESAKNFSIVDSDNKIQFEATGEETLADRRVAFTFRSKQPIPLTEYYSYRFQLKRQGQNGDAVVIPSLPYASVGQVGTDTIARQQAIVSEIYVNS